jgi:shikimate kinase
VSLIVLVGLPGSGKSTVGRQLARRLGVPFIDSDQVIEQRIGCSIRSFFEREGEAAFRDVEEATIADLMQAAAGVIATGGGAVLRPATRERLHAAANVIYLRSRPEDLFRRVRHDQSRPLLQVPNPLDRLRALDAERDPLYRETAHVVVETGRPSVSALVTTILAKLQEPGVPLPL